MKHLILLFICFTTALKACPFCDLDLIDKQQVYQSSYWRVFVDYKPVQEGHLLLVPIAHKLTRYDLSLEEIIDLYHLERLMHQVLIERFGEGIEDLQYEKNGAILQSVNHFHIHVIPITESERGILGKVRLTWKLFVPRSTLSEEQLQKEKMLFKSLFLHAESSKDQVTKYDQQFYFSWRVGTRNS